MKKILLTTISTIASIGIATAGEYRMSAKSPVSKAPVYEPAAPCFGAGFEFSGFATGFFPDESDEEIGGGAALSYFYNQNFGFEVSYSALDTDPSIEHIAKVQAVYRFVNGDSCIAPYLLGGGGVMTNGSTTGIWGGGAGIEFRGNNFGIFADGTYNWAADDREDFALARVGFRIPF